LKLAGKSPRDLAKVALLEEKRNIFFTEGHQRRILKSHAGQQ
jgi:hypothetical protein